MATEKRRQAAEDAKVARAKAAEDDNTVLDSLLEKLRKGENPRRARRARPGERAAVPAALDLLPANVSSTGDAADLARDMLARLQSDGFAAAAAPSPSTPGASRRTTRRRRASNALRLDRMDIDEAEDMAASSTGGMSDDDGAAPSRLERTSSASATSTKSPRPERTSSVSSMSARSPQPEMASPRLQPASPASDVHLDDEGEWDTTIIAAVT
jgi:hypothetical protein